MAPNLFLARRKVALHDRLLNRSKGHIRREPPRPVAPNRYRFADRATPEYSGIRRDHLMPNRTDRQCRLSAIHGQCDWTRRRGKPDA
jgi:hypothetical protein